VPCIRNNTTVNGQNGIKNVCPKGLLASSKIISCQMNFKKG
jgi:hypothetical protein